MFSLLGGIYNELIYRPILNGLIFLYKTVGFSDLGVSIILLTIAIRLILFPLFQKSQKHQIVAQKIQPKLKKIQEEHKGNPQKQSEAMMALYKEHNFNPFLGFGLLFVQIPIMVALYQVFLHVFSVDVFSGLYHILTPPESINGTFLNLINLKERSIVIVVLTAILQYIQGILMQRSLQLSNEKNDQAVQINKMMTIVGPVLTLTIFINLPAAVTLYWLVSTVINIIQQEIIQRQTKDGKLGNISS